MRPPTKWCAADTAPKCYQYVVRPPPIHTLLGIANVLVVSENIDIASLSVWSGLVLHVVPPFRC